MRHILTVGDCDISYEDLQPATPTTQRPLVLLHGLSDSNHTWNKAAPLLAERRRVIMPDLPGHGRSSRPDVSYSIRYYARILAAWAAAIGLEDFDLVGHSLGGGVAQRMLIELKRLEAVAAHANADPAVKEPKPTVPRVHRLALVASGGLGREVAWLLRLAAATGAVERIGQPFMHRGTRFGMRVLGGAFRKPERATLARLNERAGSARALSRTLGSSVGLDGQRLHFLDHAHELDSLPPIAIFWGDRDRVIPATHLDHALTYLEGITVRRFERAGHYPHRESVHEFAPALLRFLDAPQAAPRLKPRARPRTLRDIVMSAIAPFRTNKPAVA